MSPITLKILRKPKIISQMCRKHKEDRKTKGTEIKMNHKIYLHFHTASWYMLEKFTQLILVKLKIRDYSMGYIPSLEDKHLSFNYVRTVMWITNCKYYTICSTQNDTERKKSHMLKSHIRKTLDTRCNQQHMIKSYKNTV